MILKFHEASIHTFKVITFTSHFAAAAADVNAADAVHARSNPKPRYYVMYPY